MVSSTFNNWTQEELIRSNRQHEDVVSAFEAQDKEWAEAAMRAHLAGLIWVGVGRGLWPLNMMAQTLAARPATDLSHSPVRCLHDPPRGDTLSFCQNHMLMQATLPSPPG
ncbi:FCD domain-containing protein [Tabrizicola sp. WMC-M-20]|nr:FCD domain-containing protein [Tabrizicola sp. WMC-M-20]